MGHISGRSFSIEHLVRGRRRAIGILLATMVLSLWVSGCTWTYLFASGFVATGSTATYIVQLHNDEADPLGPIAAFTVLHVPTGWQFVSGSFTSTTAPTSGDGTEIADPGFICDVGPDLPAPGAGRRRVTIDWDTFADVGNPETGTATHHFAVGSAVGDYTIDTFFVAQGGGSTVCSAGISTITRVEVPLFADGFESGSTGSWSSD